MAEWPWPDNAVGRLKRVAESYRTALMDAAPDVCRQLDARMVEYGQHWIAGDSVIDVNRLATAQEIADELGINPWNVQDWARRHPEIIQRHGKKDGKSLFRLGDVLAYQAMGAHK